MASSVESCFKSELAPIVDLGLRLPTNAPCYVNVSQEGERGVGSSKISGDDKRKVVGRVISTQIPTTIQMKPVLSTSTTITTDPNINVGLSKLQQKKGISIGKGGSSSIVIKTTSTVNPPFPILILLSRICGTIFSNQNLSSILIRINNYHRNDNEDKEKVRKIILWYMEIPKVLVQTIKILS